MPKIIDEEFYGDVLAKMDRLGLRPLYDELIGILTGFELRVQEQKDSNSGKVLRILIDQRFTNQEWEKKTTGDIDWKKCKIVNGTRVCLGVEVQVSGRSDLVAVDMLHLSESLKSQIDIGVIVVPSDTLGTFLTDRVAQFSEVKRHIDMTARILQPPLIALSIEHDGPGPSLPKQKKRS